jgi:hypothetical protein
MTDLKPDKPKDEKFDEKELEKQDEKQEEKSASWDEKWRRDPLSAIVWACILIWAGIVLLMETTNILSNLRDSLNLEKLEAWPVILLGAGVIILGEVAVRLTVPAYRRSVTGSLIFAAILIGIAANDLTGKEFVWALILIVLGAVLLLRGFSRK